MDIRAFKFEPRGVVQSARQFGKSRMPLTPVEGISQDDPRFAAAQLQHLVANTVRESLLAEGHSLRSYVQRLDGVPGMTYERLVRIHRGETLMQVADLLAWAARFRAVRALLSDPDTWAEHPDSDEAARPTENRDTDS